MYKNFGSELKKYHLDTSLHRIHKEGIEKSDFGLDNSSELIGGGFGLYSSSDIRKRIGPIKTEYYRIALIRSGKVKVDIGLETFLAMRNSIVFGFPGQVFSIYDQSEDFFNYYMLFNEEFVADTFLIKKDKKEFPFLDYSGIQCFVLDNETAGEIENIILKINAEIKNRNENIQLMIQAYIQLILLNAKRNYNMQIYTRQETSSSGNQLFNRFVKLVSQHFLTHRKVSDYAELLNVSADHLNRIIKTQSQKTAHELIDDMILIEAKAYLLHTKLTISEIAYKLDFSDPSYFSKFFKKLTDFTPQQYRSVSSGKSE